MLFSILGERF